MPCEYSSANVLIRSSVNGKRRNPKKILRRRSSSGAEILTPIVSEESTSSGGGGTTSGTSSSAWHRFKKEWTRRTDSDTMLNKQRRGSLPIEVLAVGLGEKYSLLHH